MGKGVGEEARHRETCTLPRVQTGEVIYPRAQATFLPALGPSPPGLEPQRQNDRRLIVQTKTPKKMKWSPTDDCQDNTHMPLYPKATSSSHGRCQSTDPGQKPLASHGEKVKEPSSGPCHVADTVLTAPTHSQPEPQRTGRGLPRKLQMTSLGFLRQPHSCAPAPASAPTPALGDVAGWKRNSLHPPAEEGGFQPGKQDSGPRGCP